MYDHQRKEVVTESALGITYTNQADPSKPPTGTHAPSSTPARPSLFISPNWATTTTNTDCHSRPVSAPSNQRTDGIHTTPRHSANDRECIVQTPVVPLSVARFQQHHHMADTRLNRVGDVLIFSEED